ncbi:transcriptional regulator [Candidatus Bathyarchaeota archaeon]|nr:transcriptional regulator [Candidatus Bathyarchaeota archaeon]
MKLPCEIAVKSVVPAIRALLAEELIKAHEMKQSDAANLLGITQTAISKYIHHVRGRTLSMEGESKVTQNIEETAIALVNRALSPRDLPLRICSTCKLIRKQGLMCKLCKRANPTLNVEECNLCITSSCNPSEHTH